MKKYFSHQNIVTFVLVALAAAVAILFVVPAARKFEPGLKKVTPATTTT